MKKLFFLLALVCMWLPGKSQIVIPRTQVAYNVNYHWGIIDVMIARGVVTVESDGTQFCGTLDGTSIPWEGHIICVSDTLKADMSGYGSNMRERVTYQSGWYRHPAVSSFRSSCYNPDDPAFYKNIAGQGCYDASDDSMEAITVTSDMIGMYYMAHAIDFKSMSPGEKITIPIEGGYAREVVITYKGQSIYSADGDNYPAYDCTFEYSYGNSMSGYPVECKIGATDRILLYLCADLPVGRVEMLSTPR